VFEAFIALRNTEIEKAKAINPKPEVPEALFIYARKGKLRAYQKTVIDTMLIKLGEKIVVDLENHDLRRTCVHMMYRRGVKIEQIARIFGHSDTRKTM
jgi:integrase